MSTDRTGKITPLDIRLVPGDVAPRWDSAEELTPEQVIITEQGMASGRPMVDFVFRGADGQTHVYTTSARMILTLADTIEAVNLKNHGKKRP